MDVKNYNELKYTPELTDPIRLEIGRMLIAHEAIKLFPNIDYEIIKTQVATKWQDMTETTKVRNFWNLLDSLMMGYKLKDIIALITSEKIDWEFESKSPIGELHFGWNERFREYSMNGKSADEVSVYLKDHPNIANDLATRYKKPSPRMFDPIIVEKYSSDESLHVHDGNGRLLWAIATKKPTLDIYIGSQNTKLKPNHWVPTAYLQRLADKKALSVLAGILSESENAVFEFQNRVNACEDLKTKVLATFVTK